MAPQDLSHDGYDIFPIFCVIFKWECMQTTPFLKKICGTIPWDCGASVFHTQPEETF